MSCEAAAVVASTAYVDCEVLSAKPHSRSSLSHAYLGEASRYFDLSLFIEAIVRLCPLSR